MFRAAFDYDSSIDYNVHEYIGMMDVVCTHCEAAKFSGETSGICCANGKVKLPEVEPPPEPLQSLIFETSPGSKLLHLHYNSSFQMTSLCATKIIRDQFMPTFKIQGQIYHLAGSLLPLPDDSHQFLKIYFIGDKNRELNQCCTIGSHTKREILCELQDFFHQHNELVQLFKAAMDRLPSDNHRIVIRADKTPTGEHSRRFNAPTIDEVAIVIVGDQFQSILFFTVEMNNYNVFRGFIVLTMHYSILYCTGMAMMDTI
uniref:Helitron helicase-like domain-containing protein n=1 Tax=Bactrocera latifrons TaxID=174628 RepID=A0A0K8VWV8_BACLA